MSRRIHIALVAAGCMTTMGAVTGSILVAPKFDARPGPAGPVAAASARDDKVIRISVICWDEGRTRICQPH